ncbi:MAG TPA: hypothetical protein VHL78_11930 [Actinomycetota bacterium]|nr:hypothetical protein [Actinomycetota bacterium]
MAFRVIEPTRLRGAAILAAVAGVLLIVAGVAGRPIALGGAVLVAAAGAAFDGLGERRIGLRQVGVFLAALGSGLGIWALLVLALMMLLGLAPVPAMVYLLLAAALASVAGGVALIVAASRRSADRPARPASRRRPAPAPRPRRLADVATSRRAESLRAS